MKRDYIGTQLTCGRTTHWTTKNQRYSKINNNNKVKSGQIPWARCVPSSKKKTTINAVDERDIIGKSLPPKV
jgi:hypothetical protein